jgi:hypothetical protein
MPIANPKSSAITEIGVTPTQTDNKYYSSSPTQGGN